MKKLFIVILLFISICLMAQNVPQTIDYQGRLADSDGNYLNSVVTVDFLIYDTEIDGTLLWSETQDVSTANGIFHVLLGSVTSFPTDLFDNVDRWLELIVSGETLSPRTVIASVPYSIKAETAYTLQNMGSGSGLDADLLDGMDSVDFADAAHTHNHDALPGYEALEHVPVDDFNTSTSILWSSHKISEDFNHVSNDILLKQDKIARYSGVTAGLVDTIGPNTGFPFIFTIVDSNFSSATADQIDVFATGFTGTNSTTIEEPLVFYNEVIEVGDDFQIKLYVKGYDYSMWELRYIKIKCKAIYIK